MKNTALLKEKLNRMSKEEVINYAIGEALMKEFYRERLESINTKTFLKKSELLDKHQVNLFNEAEFTVDTATPEELDESAITPRPKKKAKKTREIDYSKLEVKTFHHAIDDRKCPSCGEKMVQTGQKIVEILKYQRAKYYIEKHVIYEYACNHCGEEGITKEDAPVQLVEGSKVSSSVVAGIATNKFALDVPLYRQEKDLMRQGVRITRQNMSNWLVRSCEDYLQMVFDRMHQDIQDLDIIHMDETTHVCIEDKGENREKNYEWLMVSGAEEKKQMALYFYSTNRCYDNLNDLLKIRPERFIQSDGYGAYQNEEYGRDVACLAHIRRKFHDAMITNPAHGEFKKIKDKEESIVFLERHPSYMNILTIMEMIQKLFKIDQKIKEMPVEDRSKKKEEESLPVFDMLYEKIESIKGDYAPRSKMGTALTYAIHEKEFMRNYYLDGRLEISNNRAERGIKSMVMARKNFLFSNTRRGANCSSVYLSLIESAKMNQLDPFKYIEYVLDRLSKDGLKDEVIEEVLPYSDAIPKGIRV